MSILKIQGDTLQLLENSGGLIRTITSGTVSASMSMDEEEIVLVKESGAVERWDVRGNFLQTIGYGASAARYMSDTEIAIYLESGPIEIRDSRGNLLRTVY